MNSHKHSSKLAFAASLVLLGALGLASCSVSQPIASTPTSAEPAQVTERSQPAESPEKSQTAAEKPQEEPEKGFKQVKLCQTEDGCDQDIEVVQSQTPVLYMTGYMGTLPEGSMMKGTLIYREGPVGQDIEVVSADLEKKPFQNSFTFTFNSPTEGWPAGRYEVVISTDAEGVEPVSRFFVVE